jgi:hypothetical protein
MTEMLLDVAKGREEEEKEDLADVLATELLLGLLHDLQELLEGNAAIARDISLVDDLIGIVLLLLSRMKEKGC